MNQPPGSGAGAGRLIKKNLFIILAVPAIVAIHFGWYRLQFNDRFVKESERRTRLGAVIELDPSKKDKEAGK